MRRKRAPYPSHRAAVASIAQTNPTEAGEGRGPVAPSLPFLNHLTDETINRIRCDFPGWDIYALKADFDAWIADNDKLPPEGLPGSLLRLREAAPHSKQPNDSPVRDVFREPTAMAHN